MEPMINEFVDSEERINPEEPPHRFWPGSSEYRTKKPIEKEYEAFKRFASTGYKVLWKDETCSWITKRLWKAQLPHTVRRGYIELQAGIDIWYPTYLEGEIVKNRLGSSQGDLKFRHNNTLIWLPRTAVLGVERLSDWNNRAILRLIPALFRDQSRGQEIIESHKKEEE
jgi:hypothetical protein